MSRLEKLKELEKELYSLMKKANSRTFATLARQYRETLKEIEEIEGADDNEDEIAKLLSGDGQSDSDN
jgi:replicative DNA helicase